jgi:hypothetical protein
VGAVAYLLNPFSLVWLEHPLAAVPPWLPWMLLAGERLSADRVAAGGGVTVRRLRAVAWLALSTALVLGAGHPHTGMFVAMLGGAYAVCRAWTSAQPWRSIAGAAFGLTLGCAMVAVQILPFLEYVSLSRGIATRGGYALNPFFAPTSTLITALVPNFLGDHSAGNFAGPTNYLEQQTYPGVAVWVLAVLALVSGARTWRAWFFAGAGAAAMLVMYGAPGALQLASLPLIRAASLPRAAIVTLASLSVLAALGADAVLRADRGGRRSLPIATTLVAGCAIVVLILSALRTSKAFLAAKGLEEYTTHWASVGIWLTTLVVVVASSRLRSLIGRSASGVLIVAAIALDLLLVGRGFHRLIPPDQVFPVLPEIEIVRRDPGLFRVLGLGGSLMPNAAMAYGLQDVRGYDGLGVARYADLLDAVFRYEHSAHLAVGLHSPLIDLLNVKYVFGAPNIAVPQDGWFTRLTVGEVALYRNNRVRPRAFLVDGYTVLDGNPARRALRDGLVDFRRVALVEQELRPVARPVQAASPDVIGSAIVTRYEDELVEIETEAPDRRVLVLMDVHYPGWTATIDGRPEPIVRANFAFRAVPVPAGRHAIRFEYRPASFRRGLAVSATAAAIILGLLLGVLPGRRRPPARPDA